MAKLTKEEKAARRKERKAAGKGLWDEFKAFINKGNAFMLAVGVVIGGAFSAIVTAFVNILTSLATWPVPGGLKGLVTVLPAVTDPQKGAAMQIGGETVYKQFFSTAEVNDMVIAFAKAQGVDITTQSDTFVQQHVRHHRLGFIDQCDYRLHHHRPRSLRYRQGHGCC